jgi:MFS family permease
MSVPPTASPGPAQVAPRAGLALALLLAINLFNYMDRQVLSAVLKRIELDADIFRPDDPWLKTKLGLLATAFMASYMLLAPVFGRLTDRAPRWWVVGLGVILWSIASGASGLAGTYAALLLTRCCVGVGEAAYGPVAPSMLSDLYPERNRGKVLAGFYLAIPVGSALGFVVGGQVAEWTGDWRWAFYVVVIPGVVLGLLCFLMREPPRLTSRGEQPAIGYAATVRRVMRVPSFVYCTVGMTFYTFVLGGVALWIPHYVFEREARFVVTPETLTKLAEMKATNGIPLVPPEVVDKIRPLAGPDRMTFDQLAGKLRDTLGPDLQKQYQARIFDATTAPDSPTLGKIDFYFGAIVVLSGLGATLLGGWLGDRLRGRWPGAYFRVSGYSTLLAFPFFLAMLYVPFPAAWGMVFAAVFLLFMNTGPTNTILANVTPSALRPTAFALNILIIHALGDAISPWVLGFVADVSSLQRAMELVAVLILVGGLVWVRGARHLDEDTRRVTSAESATAPVQAPT